MAQQIYLGPNHPKGLIIRATIYKNGVPADVTALLDKCPSAKALLVDTVRTSAVMADLRQKDSAYRALFANAEKEFEETLKKKEAN